MLHEVSYYLEWFAVDVLFVLVYHVSSYLIGSRTFDVIPSLLDSKRTTFKRIWPLLCHIIVFYIVIIIIIQITGKVEIDWFGNN